LYKDDPRAECVLLVPATPVGYLLTWEEGEAVQLALHRAQTALATLRMVGIPMYESHIGDASPLKAIDDELQRRGYAAVVISTLPPGLSEWVKTDLPTQVAQQHPRVKVIHVVSQRSPVQVDWPRAVAYFGGRRYRCRRVATRAGADSVPDVPHAPPEAPAGCGAAGDRLR
jgi:hypothetical protein